MTAGAYNQNVQVLQTEDHLVLWVEMIHDARIVPIDSHPPPWIRTSANGWGAHGATGTATPW